MTEERARENNIENKQREKNKTKKGDKKIDSHSFMVRDRGRVRG